MTNTTNETGSRKVFANRNGNAPDPTERERIFKDVLREVFSTTDMEVKSVLSLKQMVHLVRLGVYAKRFNSPLAKAVYDWLLKMPVSTDAKGGRGRSDMVETLKALIAQGQTEENPKEKSLIQRMLR